jgi:hypothetical protein
LTKNLHQIFGFSKIVDQSFDYLKFFQNTLTNYQQFEDQSIQYFETLFEFMSIYFDFAPDNHAKTFNTVSKSLGSNVKIIKKFLSYMVRENLESENFEKIFLSLVENALKESSDAEFVEIFSLWSELRDLFGLFF